MQLLPESGDVGRRIDQVLARLERIGSRSSAERLIRNGAVKVDGRPASKSHRVRASEVIEVDDSALAEPPPREYASTEVPVLYQDEHVLVVDKPAGMVVHPAPGFRESTLVESLASSGVELAPAEDQAIERPGVVHRLDKDTSGVIVLAKNVHTLRSLQQAIQERRVRREYMALVHGSVASRAGRVEAAIGRDVRDPTRRSLETETPQDAITHFVVLELLPDTTLLRLWLETGRTHQIRVHMQAIEHPVVGDPVYGRSGELGLSRQFLHAARLAFPHPRTGEEIEVTSPLPDDLSQALDQARRS